MKPSHGVGRSRLVVHFRGQGIYPIQGTTEPANRFPQFGVLGANLLQRCAAFGKRSEIEADVGPCTGNRSPERPEGHHDVGDQGRISVRSQPFQVFDGLNGVIPQHRGGFGRFHGCFADGLLTFRTGVQPERCPESFGGYGVLVCQAKGRLPQGARPAQQVLPRVLRVAGHH